MAADIGIKTPFIVAATPGAATPLSTSKLLVFAAVIVADESNTDAVVVGESGILGSEPGIQPGTQFPSLGVDAPRGSLIDLSKVYVRSASGNQNVIVFAQG